MRQAETTELTPREAFRQRQRKSLDYYFSFTKNEDVVREYFEGMALRTYDQLPETNKPSHSFSIEAHSALNLANEPDHIHNLISLNLIQEWQAWKQIYDDLLNRNPRLALYDLMHWIGETHDFSSWPFGLEMAISNWIDAGEREPMPFDDRRGIITPDFYARLQRASRGAGGFLFFESGAGTRFLPEAEWQQKKTFDSTYREEKARRLQARQDEEAARKADPVQRRIAKILVQARGEPGFWDALRSWETVREEHRPSRQANIEKSDLVGSIGIRRHTGNSSPTGGTDPDTLLLDTLLANFLRRVHTAEDSRLGLTVPLVVAILRGTVRDELGFDGTLVWPGGPSLGEGGP